MEMYTKYNHQDPRPAPDNLPTATDPQYRDECDINVVVARALRGSVPDNIVHDKGSFADVSEFGDFATMMDIVNRGTAAFMDVPSSVRARFGNDPRAFFAFCNDPSNSAELVKLGLAEYVRKEEPLPVRVEVVNPKDESKATA